MHSDINGNQKQIQHVYVVTEKKMYKCIAITGLQNNFL